MLPDLSRRSTEAEIMDTAATHFDEYDDCLRHIEIINKLTGGYRPVLSWLKKTLPESRPDRPFSIIDIGCGRGEMLRLIRRWANREGLRINLTGIDVNHGSIAAAKKATPD